MIKFFPIIFVILWSSAFITTKPITDYSDPFSALAFRFLIVALGFLIYSIYKREKILIKKKFALEALASGILFHGIYLGGVFFSVSRGLPTGIVALIVTLQPILTNILASPLLNEKITSKQWIGVILGFSGAFLVLGFDVGTDLTKIGVISAFVALISVTSATIWQKKLSNNLPLSISNMYQAIGGCLFNILLIFTIGNLYIDFSLTFMIAMGHQIILISFGAFTILMFMIKRNSASKTVTLFFLVPPTTALMAFVFLSEKLNSYDLLGFFIASVGVYIATKNK
tara:strand:- start:1275 stop:2126 length:852 start_codon:yes stop_codon:yes gene_type:complete